MEATEEYFPPTSSAHKYQISVQWISATYERMFSISDKNHDKTE